MDKSTSLLKKFKATALDIEATNLAANFGYMLCSGLRHQIDGIWQRRTKVLSVLDHPVQHRKDPTVDKHLLKALRAEIADSHLLIAHYGGLGRYDIPFINTRLMANGLDPLPDIPIYDTWKICRTYLRLNSNRLASLTTLFNVEEKTRLDGTIWIRAAAGHIPSIRYVIRHCRVDVDVLVKIYEQLCKLKAPRVGRHSLVAFDGRCPYCKYPELIRGSGDRLTVSGYKERWQCKSCRKQFTDPKVIKPYPGQRRVYPE